MGQKIFDKYYIHLLKLVWLLIDIYLKEIKGIIVKESKRLDFQTARLNQYVYIKLLSEFFFFFL